MKGRIKPLLAECRTMVSAAMLNRGVSLGPDKNKMYSRIRRFSHHRPRWRWGHVQSNCEPA